MSSSTSNAVEYRIPALPVFVLSPAAEMAAELGLPAVSNNIFQRLIRNPHAESDRAKERECAEMLCALLQNAPTLRFHLLGWMAGLVGLQAEKLNDLSVRIDTEQAIGSKRDDLRIVATVDEDQEEQPVLVWTVEIKVGSSFHESGGQFSEDVDSGADESRMAVNQLINYDHWLAEQQARHKAGFVLALYDRTKDLPRKLACPWRCLSWTALGEQIAKALRTDEMAAGEELLARHALGFIRDNLWRASEMSDKRLDYNDVSLIRAFAVLAKECEEKVERLVEPLVEVVKKSGIGRGKVSHGNSLFVGNTRSVVYRELARNSWLYAGIGGDSATGEDYLCVWIESPAKHPRKSAFKTAIKSVAGKLLKRNSNWEMPSQDAQSGWSAWDDVMFSVPLATLLVADDQEKTVCKIVADALEDLKETGIIDAFNRTIGSTTKRKRK